MDTESTKTLLWKFPVSGNGKVNNTDKQGFEFSVRKAVKKNSISNPGSVTYHLKTGKSD